MSANRDEFSEDTKRVLTLRVAARCSNPHCRKPTSGPNTDPAKVTNVGVAAHICAAAPGGPRYDAAMTPEERKSPCNGIWLCQTCAKLIDSDEKYYTKEMLHSWKNNAESFARQSLEQPGNAETSIIEDYEDRWFLPRENTHQINWGYSHIDDYCKLSPGSIVLLAGYTETDVAAYIQNIVRHNIKASRSCLYFNLKEASTSIVNRMLAAESFVEAERIRTGMLTDEDWQKITLGMSILQENQLIFEPYDIKQSMDQYILKAIQYSNADILVIDDLSGLGLNSQALSSFMYKLRSTAVQNNTSVFIVLNIDTLPKRMDKRPMLSDSIVNELHKFADVVQFVYQDDFDECSNSKDTAKTEVIFVKNYSMAKACTIRLMKLLKYTAMVEYEENQPTKYPGALAGLEAFAKYLQEI